MGSSPLTAVAESMAGTATTTVITAVVTPVIPLRLLVLGGEEFWIDQPHMDRYGNSTFVPLWVPPHWDCWY